MNLFKFTLLIGCLNLWGLSSFGQVPQEYLDAGSELLASVKSRTNADFSIDNLSAINNLGADDKIELDQALFHFNLYLNWNSETRKSTDALTGLAETQFLLAGIDRQKRFIVTAIQRYRQSDSLFLLLHASDKVYESSLILSNLYIEIGDYEIAEIYGNQAMETAKGDERKSEALGSLSEIAEESYSLDDALSKRYEQLALVKSFSQENQEAHILNEIGNLYWKLGEKDSAPVFHRRAIKKQKQNSNSEGLAFSYYYLSRIYLDKGDKDSALYYITFSERLHRDSENFPGLASSWMGLGEMYNQEGDLGQALKYFKSAGRIFARENMVIETALAWGKAGAIYREMGDLKEALNYFDDSIESLENQFRYYSGENSKQALIRKTLFIYELAILSSLDLNRVKEAYSFLQLSRSRTLNEILAESEFDKNQLPEELIKKGNEIKKELSEINKRIALNHQVEKESSLFHEKEIALRKRKLFDAEVRSLVPNYNRLTSPEVVEPYKLQQTLGRKEVLVDFFVGKKEALAFVISRENIEMVKLGSPDSINWALENFRTQYIQRCNQAYTENLFYQQGIPMRFFRSVRILNKLIWTKIDQIDWLKKQKLILVPDGPLHYLPFELLFSDTEPTSYDKYNYLIKRYEITYVPSATTLFMSRQAEKDKAKEIEEKDDYRYDFLGFADPIFEGDRRLEGYAKDMNGFLIPRGKRGERLVPLANTALEVRKIAEMFNPKYTQLYLRESATEDNLKSLNLKDFRYIHFSSHAQVNPKIPELSSIALTDDGNPHEDGKLEMFEIFDLEMKPELVVLSACETGVGKYVKGEGIIGFTRSLLYAGTPTVILSLWSVADKSTSRLFIDYYYFLLKGGQDDKYTGLRKAQLSMIKSQTRFSNPYFWAPFVFIGER